MRIALYSPDVPGTAGGVSDHTLVLARALAARGADIVVLAGRGAPERFAPIPCRIGVHPLAHHGNSLAEAVRTANARWVLVQYVPFLYARRGVAPSLVAGLLATRRVGVRIALIVHEPYVPFTRLAWLFTGLPMRCQFHALVRICTFVYTPVPHFARLAERHAGSGTIVRVAPVGSNIPVARVSRDKARAALGLTSDDVAIGVFSPAASGYLHTWIAAAAMRLARRVDVVWVFFGAGSDHLPSGFPPGVNHKLLRYLDPEAVSHVLAALDLTVAPFVDGLTLRRGSAMAELAHSVPVVSSTGPLFDESLSAAAHCLATREAFVHAVEELVADRDARVALGAAGRAHYDRAASTEVLADILLRDVTARGARP